MLEDPIDQINRQLQDLQQAGAGMTRVRRLLGVRRRMTDGPRDDMPPGALSVSFDGVWFAYDDEPVLRDVTFHLAPGETLGILGRTGSGKTTISRLLFRLYDPTRGAVEVGGIDPRSRTIESYRSRIDMVTQDIHLFHASVRDNLTLFDRSIPDPVILQVLCDLGLDDWYSSLPAGLDSVLPSGGGGLSAGEAQLLAFARVFLRDPGVVILDEASSRLDPATEAKIEHAVDRLLQGRTGIIIAHRLSTIRRVDRVLILDEGHVVEEGVRSALESDLDSRLSGLLRRGLEEVGV
jgi:ATP-binding cassette subfamily B protein